ncbi:alanine racemase [Chloroflexia bacterium SDU3-3]|nr:alanine racemase [Chloroflexia bacterium SDU3-3]
MLEYYEPATSERRAQAEVDTAAIESNARLMRRVLGPGCQLIGVAKADAYGHGAVGAVQAMLRGGATCAAVATVGEGRRLRAAGIDAPILVLGPASRRDLHEALALGLQLMVGDAAMIQAVAAAAEATGHQARVHLKIDTGMHRLGLLPHEALPVLRATPGAGVLRWEGIFTHFACADEPTRPETHFQIAAFEEVVGALAAAGYRFPLVHAASSAGALAFPEARYSAARVGIALYGVAPSDEVGLPAGFQPALTFRTSITRVAELPAGSQVSYGGVYRTPGPQRIATIGAGYADGLRRSPPWQQALVGGVRVPIVGRICMDYAMVDVTDLDAQVEDEVVLMGRQGEASISAAEVGQWLGTSAYEVLTTILPGEPRS